MLLEDLYEHDSGVTCPEEYQDIRKHFYPLQYDKFAYNSLTTFPIITVILETFHVKNILAPSEQGVKQVVFDLSQWKSNVIE